MSNHSDDNAVDSSHTMIITQPPMCPFELPISLIIDGYLKRIYNDEDDRLIPVDIILVCGDYYGYSLCCLAATNHHRMNILSQERYVVRELWWFFRMDHHNHTLNSLQRDDLNLTAALFTSIVSHHMRCFNYLMTTKKWNKPILVGSGYYSDSYCLLHAACRSNNIEVVNKLMNDPCIDIDEPTKDNQTPLSIAVDGGHYDIAAKLLHTNKVDVNHQYGRNNRTPLIAAAESGYIQLVKLLISHNVCLHKNNMI